MPFIFSTTNSFHLCCGSVVWFNSVPINYYCYHNILLVDNLSVTYNNAETSIEIINLGYFSWNEIECVLKTYKYEIALRKDQSKWMVKNHMHLFQILYIRSLGMYTSTILVRTLVQCACATSSEIKNRGHRTDLVSKTNQF